MSVAQAQSLAHDVIGHFLNWVSADSKEVRMLACDSLEHCHEQCLESIVRIGAAAAPGRQKKMQPTLRGRVCCCTSAFVRVFIFFVVSLFAVVFASCVLFVSLCNILQCRQKQRA